jgi:murein DD-endopeptidase MepM/ murein hydrolase activator NlpD
MVLALSLVSWSLGASEGYEGKGPVIKPGPKGALIHNPSCSSFTVWVNRKDFGVAQKSQVPIGSHNWDSYQWVPGLIGEMKERQVQHPLSSKMAPTFGADAGDTHSGADRYSYDFATPEGTPVLAMEAGRVIRIVEHYELAHRDPSKKQEVNRVFILHQDGSVASYVHLKPHSVVVKMCQEVKARERIALSGHNGYSSGPHLHVDIFRPLPQGKHHTIPLRFLP